MSKRWSREDDSFIVAYFDTIGPFIGPHDLGRSEKSVAGRAGFLRKSGAWAAIERIWAAENEYRCIVDGAFARAVARENAAVADIKRLAGSVVSQARGDK